MAWARNCSRFWLNFYTNIVTDMSHFDHQELGFICIVQTEGLLQEASFMKSRKVRLYEMGGVGAYLVTGGVLVSEVLGLYGPETLVFLVHVATCLLVVHVI